MGHYKSNVRDLEFNLFEVLGIGDLFDAGAYGDLDSDTVRHILTEVARLAEGPIAQSFADADRNPATLDAASHTVTIPESLLHTIRAMNESGWSRVGLPAELDGTPAPAVLVYAIAEMFHGANPAAQFFNLGPMMSKVLYTVGTEQQKRWAAHGLTRGWAATMVLTEPDAGSDVGAGRTRAIPQPDGSWHLEGVKRFISAGDVGAAAENIFHLVLARPVGAPAGTKGLSLFYVPKYRFDPQTMELGERNGVYATGIEHKMGLRSSPTCELTFGATDNPAVGWLVGDVHNGIAQMFHVLENARMGVGVKATGTLSTGYLNALDYARHRVQGVDLTQLSDKTAERVSIIRHPEVRRSLLLQKAYAEGLRALYLYAASHQDTVVAQHVSGADPELAARVSELLLPVVKGHSSERAYELLAQSLQVLGGSGYLQDYPIEQYLRDAKIDTVYEGTTAIQAMDLFFRKIIRDGGAALTHLTTQIAEHVDTGAEELAEERALLGSALAEVQAMTGALTGYLLEAQHNPREVYKIGLASTRYLHALGDLVIGWRLQVQAEIAANAVQHAATDTAFYRGKIATSSMFTREVLPHLAATRTILATVGTDVMDLDDAAF